MRTLQVYLPVSVIWYVHANQQESYVAFGIVSPDHRVHGDIYIADDIITSAGNVGVGVSAFGTNGTYVLGINADGTVPSSSPAGMIQIFADDSSDGAANATLAVRTEQSVETVGTFTPSHKVKVWWNGVEYWIQLDAV